MGSYYYQRHYSTFFYCGAPLPANLAVFKNQHYMLVFLLLAPFSFV